MAHAFVAGTTIIDWKLA
jgi:hypothetical protein